MLIVVDHQDDHRYPSFVSYCFLSFIFMVCFVLYVSSNCRIYNKILQANTTLDKWVNGPFKSHRHPSSKSWEN